MGQDLSPEAIREIVKSIRLLVDNEDSPFVEIEEACSYLNISKSHLNQMCKENKIAYVRLGKGTKLFVQKDLDEYQSIYNR